MARLITQWMARQRRRVPPMTIAIVSASLSAIRFFGVGSLAVKRSEEHTSELQSLMRSSYAVCCWKKNTRPDDTAALPGCVAASSEGARTRTHMNTSHYCTSRLISCDYIQQ